MDPAGAAGLFLDRLVNVAGWAGLDPWVAAQDVQVSAYDGHPRAANNYSTVVGGNYLAKTDLAIALTQQLYADPGLSLVCGGGPSGTGGPVPIAIPALPAAPAPYSGPAGGGPCDVPDGGGCIREATAHLRAAVLAAFPDGGALGRLLQQPGRRSRHRRGVRLHDHHRAGRDRAGPGQRLDRRGVGAGQRRRARCGLRDLVRADLGRPAPATG